MLMRVLAATVAGGITFFLLGFIIYGVLLDKYMKENMISYPGLMKEPMPDMVPLVIANLVLAGLFAFVFEYWATIRTFVGGLRGGAIMTFLLALHSDLIAVSMMNLMKGMTPIVVDIIVVTVMGALAGGVVGLVLGVMNKEQRSAG